MTHTDKQIIKHLVDGLLNPATQECQDIYVDALLQILSMYYSEIKKEQTCN